MSSYNQTAAQHKQYSYNTQFLWDTMDVSNTLDKTLAVTSVDLVKAFES